MRPGDGQGREESMRTGDGQGREENMRTGDGRRNGRTVISDDIYDAFVLLRI